MLSPVVEQEAACLHGLFEAQAARTPEAVAIVSGRWRLTYGLVNRRANRLAHFLRERGVGPESIVGVCAESAPETVIGMLAVLKAGGAYLPLDPAYPAERLGFMLADARAHSVLTQRGLRAGLPPEYQSTCLCLDTDEGQWSSQPPGNPESLSGPDGLAYVIYTSGSTGQPKGVLLTHGGAAANLRWRQTAFPLGGRDRMLQSYSFSFDPSVWAIFWPLSAGAALVLPRPGGIADAAYLAQTLAEEAITVVGFGPAMLQAILARPEVHSCRSLRHVFCGGEPMPPDLPGRVHALFPQAALHNVYGPTEATIDAACWTVPPHAPAGPIPIGFPIAGTELLLLDDDLRPVPDGAEGELYIAGAGLARGYLNRPDLSAERFLPHPFSPTPGARVYRTGDLARRGPGGDFYYIARRDGQVKLRGFRIELEEIEAALRRHPAVGDALVALREDRPGEARLVGYVIAPEGAAPAGADLGKFLSASLPAHMIPSAFVALDAFPLSPSGKRDRRALPPPGPRLAERGPDSQPPLDPLQHQLAQIWEDLLDVRPVGIGDSFRDLGGHSLLAARMLAQIADACGRSLPLSALYEGDTVAHLADVLRRGEAAPDGPLSPIARGGARRPFFFGYGFHPLGGLYCHGLARHLSPEQPFYALHPPKAGGSLTVEGMAADAVRAVREVQPHGPYRLGGFCGSGLVAYEMARQLTAAGQTVEFLALIETHTINAAFRLRLRRWAGDPARFLAAQCRLLPPFAAVQSLWRRVRGRAEPALVEACDRAAGAYVPRPYAGLVTLLRAADDPETFPGDPVSLWREVAPLLSIRDTPGTHRSCLLEDLPGLGARLAACLDAEDLR